jgi:hypothetical protein
MRLGVYKRLYFKESTKSSLQVSRIKCAQKQFSRINNALSRKINAQKSAVCV